MDTLAMYCIVYNVHCMYTVQQDINYTTNINYSLVPILIIIYIMSDNVNISWQIFIKIYVVFYDVNISWRIFAKI